ncbi:LysR family transcriptional regulator [Azospirillum brasilense]|nr:LysR family transcriptional regulator [Azospirillum brasilense]
MGMGHDAYADMHQRMAESMVEDWNNVRVVLEVARTGSLSKAAAALGVDQATISRRIATLESRAGVPLFERRSTGTRPTANGQMLVEAAETVSIGIETFQRTLRGLSGHNQPVSVSAAEGISTYLLGPMIAGCGEGLPLYAGSTMALPPIVLTPPDQPADIEVVLVGPGEDVPRSPETRIRKLGHMRFVPVAGQRYLASHGTPEKFDSLKGHRLLNHAMYQYDPGLTPWNEIIDGSRSGVFLTVPTSSALHRPVKVGAGISLLPDFSHLLDMDVVPLPDIAPKMTIDLWLASHRETLRSPMVRSVYDAIGEMFNRSHWFSE